MTISAVIGGEQWVDFASTRGMGDFTRWVEILDADEFPLLSHLVDWGWVNEIDDLLDELERGVRNSEPMLSVRNTINGFTSALENKKRKAESVMLTDGLTPEDVKEEWYINGERVI